MDNGVVPVDGVGPESGEREKGSGTDVRVVWEVIARALDLIDGAGFDFNKRATLVGECLGAIRSACEYGVCGSRRSSFVNVVGDGAQGRVIDGVERSIADCLGQHGEHPRSGSGSNKVDQSPDMDARSGGCGGLDGRPVGSLFGVAVSPEGLTGETVKEGSRKGCIGEETTLERNRRWRREKKLRKKRRQSSSKSSEACDAEGLSDSARESDCSNVKQGKSSAATDTLQGGRPLSALELAKETLAKKWAIENELAAERARRSLEVVRATDLQDDIRRHVTMVKRHTEANMVAIEKTHKYLSKTGNVAGEPAGGQGFAETIIGESISPDSSASMQEFRAAQKQVLDLQQRCEKLEKAYKKAGGNPDAIDLYDKSLFTMENGTIAQHYVDQFEDFKLSWGIPENAVEFKNGKKKTRIDFYGVKEDDDFNNFYGDC